MSIFKKIRQAGTAVICAVVLVVSADDGYQFIISGYPAENVSNSLSTASVALETGTYRHPLDSTALEARYRSKFATAGVALDTSKYKAFTLIIR